MIGSIADQEAECGSSYRSIFRPPSYLLGSPVGRLLIGENWDSISARGSVPAEVDCVVVGGGLAAVTTGAYLHHSGIDFCILDEQEYLGQRFRNWAHQIGMRVMRSPYEHYCGCRRVFDYSMLDIAKMCESRLVDFERDQLLLATAGQRSVVPLDVFEAHLYHTIRSHSLHDHHVRDRVLSVEGDGGSYIVVTERGREIKARYVIEATGECPRQQIASDDRLVDWPQAGVALRESSSPLIIGGGQTAANIINGFLRRDVEVTAAFPALPR